MKLPKILEHLICLAFLVSRKRGVKAEFNSIPHLVGNTADVVFFKDETKSPKSNTLSQHLGDSKNKERTYPCIYISSLSADLAVLFAVRFISLTGREGASN